MGETAKELRVVFDGPPGPQSGRFVEVEAEDGRSVNAGEWHERDDGLWELRFTTIAGVVIGPEELEKAADAVAQVAGVTTKSKLAYDITHAALKGINLTVADHKIVVRSKTGVAVDYGPDLGSLYDGDILFVKMGEKG